MLTHTRNRLRSVLAAIGSLLPRSSRSAGDNAANGRRTVRPWRDDAFHSYPTVGLTPAAALAYVQQADSGSPALQFELFSEMLQKWPRLAAVQATRRLALTGLDWEILPSAPPASAGPPHEPRPSGSGLGANGPSSAGARAVAVAGANPQSAITNPQSIRNSQSTIRNQDVVAFCRDTLGGLERFKDTLDFLATALGHGVALAELVWERGRLIDLVPVPHSRLLADPVEPWRIRVRTEDDPTYGVAIDEQPNKWIVHRPRVQPGRQFESGMLRASLLLYIAQNLSFKDWLIYSQIAGMPVRVAQFEPGTPESDKAELLKMLEALGTDAVAIFSKGVELKFLDAPRSSADRPYEPLQRYCNTEITILWLGQHLTTDLTGQGSRAAAEVHDRVREDLLVHDIAAEGQTLRRDVLTPLVRARFGDGVPVPHFRRSLVESIDTRALAETIGVAVNDIGLSVPRRWAHRALGIPEAAGDEPVLTAATSIRTRSGSDGFGATGRLAQPDDHPAPKPVASAPGSDRDGRSAIQNRKLKIQNQLE